MSVIHFEIEVRKAGSLRDADSTPQLRDAANSYGIKRRDTGAVVIAAGTYLTRLSLGTYRYTLSDAVAGVTYDYAARLVVDGSTIDTVGERRAASASTTLPCYLTIEEGTDLATQLGLARFNAADDANKLAALVMATARIDARKFQGMKYAERTGERQVLAFPRYDPIDGRVYEIDDDGATPVVPVRVKMAVVVEADSLLDVARAARLAAAGDGVTAQAVGSISESYDAQLAIQARDSVAPRAVELLAPFALRSGRML